MQNPEGLITTFQCIVNQWDAIHKMNNLIHTVDLFLNWRNPVLIATLQMIGHVLLSTNF